MQPPVDSMDGLWSEQEREAVMRMQRYSIVGDRDTIRERLPVMLAETGADEVIVSAQIYDHQARLRSYQLLAETVLGA